MADDLDGKLKKRPRSPTLLNLSWLRERLSKAERIKDKVESGAYDLNSEAVAKALLNEEKN